MKKRVLRLARETIRPLDGPDLEGGGQGGTSYVSACNTTSNRSVGDCTGTCPSFFTCAPDCIIWV